MKILLCVIFKDDTEYPLAERMLASFMPHTQGLCATLTGPSGEHTKLIELIKAHNGVYNVISPETNPEVYIDGSFSDFATARNINFELADKQEGFDWYTWADVDDVLINGEELATVAEKAKEMRMDAVFFNYWYSVQLRDDGTFGEDNVEVDHLRERLLRPGVFKWVSRLHEIAVSKDDNYKPLNTEYCYDTKEGHTLAWVHLTDRKRTEANIIRNTKILELKMAEEEGKDPRTVFYLAKTYYDLRDPKVFDKCLELLEKYRETSGWEEERESSWEFTARILGDQGKHAEAIAALHNASMEYPSKHMIYLLLAKEYSEIGQHDKSKFWLQTALKMPPPRTSTTIGSPLETKIFAASLKYNEAMRSQDFEGAIHWIKVRNKLGNIKDDGVVSGLEDVVRLNSICHGVFNYAKWLKDNGHMSNIRKLLESLPLELGREQFAHFIANDVNEPKVWGSDTIVYYASWGVEHFEKWSPKSLDKGIGGSETAVIELVKRWAKMGCKVTVFGDPREDAGEYQGVSYRPWYEINWQDTFNTFILWRSPHLLDREIKTKRLFMDLHDVASQLDYTQERMDKLTGIFFKSKYHRNQVPKLPDDKAFVISNGVHI